MLTRERRDELIEYTQTIDAHAEINLLVNFLNLSHVVREILRSLPVGEPVDIYAHKDGSRECRPTPTTADSVDYCGIVEVGEGFYDTTADRSGEWREAVERLERACSRAEAEYPHLAAPDGTVAVRFTDLRTLLLAASPVEQEVE